MTLNNKVLKVKRKQFEDGLLKFRIDSTYLESIGRNPSVKIMRKHWGEDAYCIRIKSKGGIKMDNLTFTAEQKEQLKTNVLAIERYIEENVVPYITGDVRLEFGGIHHCPRTGTPTAMYTLCVSPEKKSRYAGWNVYKNAEVSEIDGNSRKLTYDALAVRREEFDNYELMAFVCEGDNVAKMKWFRRINIAIDH